MTIHILGICGTFMGGVAILAKALGHDVEGSDQNIYPPMSTQLEELGMRLHVGYRAEHLQGKAIAQVIIGNALSRGNPAVEHILEHGLDYASGPAWLGEALLKKRKVLAVAGTHGKTTTTSMLAWILEYAGCAPGFLVGGIPENFGVSAALGQGDEFVIEADEYDTAFFDKRSKFLHYRPRIAILNNLEFDHADIFPDLAAIQRQFHYFIRTVPGNGKLIVNGDDANLAETLKMGCWTPIECFSTENRQADWYAESVAADSSHFVVYHRGQKLGEAAWALLGKHNMKNALAAIAAANATGVKPEVSLQALASFKSPKRRLEEIAKCDGITVYDDFAHHPTAIKTTLAGLRAKFGKTARIIVAFEPRSNTMKLGIHAHELAGSFQDADRVFLLVRDDLKWNPHETFGGSGGNLQVKNSVDELLAELTQTARTGDHVVFMSNGDFGGAINRFANR